MGHVEVQDEEDILNSLDHHPNKPRSNRCLDPFEWLSSADFCFFVGNVDQVGPFRAFRFALLQPNGPRTDQKWTEIALSKLGVTLFVVIWTKSGPKHDHSY